MAEQDNEHEHTRVVVVDDHAMVRASLRVALMAAGDLELVGEAADGEEALRVCEAARPDVVVMDLKLPKLDGIRAIRELRLRAPKIKVLALTTFPEEHLVQGALQAGAVGYVLKNVELDMLLQAIRSV